MSKPYSLYCGFWSYSRYLDRSRGSWDFKAGAERVLLYYFWKQYESEAQALDAIRDLKPHSVKFKLYHGPSKWLSIYSGVG